MADFWNQLGGLVGAGINMAGIESARNDLISAGQQANVGAQQIGQTAFEQDWAVEVLLFATPCTMSCLG